jgi:hypothetical protein
MRVKGIHLCLFAAVTALCTIALRDEPPRPRAAPATTCDNAPPHPTPRKPQAARATVAVAARPPKDRLQPRHPPHPFRQLLLLPRSRQEPPQGRPPSSTPRTASSPSRTMSPPSSRETRRQRDVDAHNQRRSRRPHAAPLVEQASQARADRNDQALDRAGRGVEGTLVVHPAAAPRAAQGGCAARLRPQSRSTISSRRS